MSPPTAREFLDALGSGDAAVVKAGYERLHAELRHVFHPLVRQALHDASGGALHDLGHSFIVFLCSDKGRASRETLQSWKGVRVAALHWLHRERRRERSIDRQAGLYKELLAHKVRLLLRSSEEFERVSAGYALRGEARGTRLEDDIILARLPPITARLTSSREDQSPEVASKADVAAQLVRVLTLSGNEPRNLSELVALVWRSLVPTPGEHESEARTSRDEDTAGPEDELPSRDLLPQDAVLEAEWGARIDLEAYALLASLKPRVIKVVGLRFCDPDDAPTTFEEIGRRVGISTSLAASALDSFKKSFRDWTNEKEIELEHQAQFLSRTLEIIRAGDFLLPRDVPRP